MKQIYNIIKVKITKSYEPSLWWFEQFVGEYVNVIHTINSDNYYAIDDDNLDATSFDFYDFKDLEILGKKIKIYGQIPKNRFISLVDLRKDKIKRIIND